MGATSSANANAKLGAAEYAQAGPGGNAMQNSGTGAATKTKKGKRLTRDSVELTLLGLPTAIWFILFAYLPMFGTIIAFKNYKPVGENFIDSLLKSSWVGLNNFKFLLLTPDALIVLRNTLLYNVVFIVVGMAFSVTLAVLISQLYSRVLARVCQTMMFLPHFLSWVVISYFTFSFFSQDKGLFNQIVKSMGGEAIDWYSKVSYWPVILLVVNLWKGMGYSMVVYLATITSMDQSLYEAAAIDGANKRQQAFRITLPLLRPIMIILFILSLGRIFSSDFGLFYFVPRDSGPLYDVTQTIDIYVYFALMKRNNIGFGSAAALMQSAFGLVTIMGANLIVKKLNPDYSLF